MQSIGRGLRRTKDKVEVVMYDIADDMSYRSRRNYTLNHFLERINIYNEQQFNYEISKVNLNKMKIPKNST